MMSSVEEKTWIILEADDLPDMGLSGNRRRGAVWAELAKKESDESEKWFLLFHNQVLAAQSDPRMAPMPWKKASINVELTFKEKRRRDLDNIMIAMKPLHDTLPYRIGIVIVSRAFSQQKNVLVSLSRSVCYALWHGVGLAPDYVRPEVPPVSL